MKLSSFSNNMICKARETGRGKNLVLEFLKFLLVYFTSEAILGITTEIFSSRYPTTDTLDSMLFLLVDIIGIVYISAFCRFCEKRPLVSVGFAKEKALEQYAHGLGMGFVVITAVYILGCLFGVYHINGISAGVNPLLLLAFFVCYMVQGMYEELLCRGFLMISVSRKHPVWVGVLVSSVFFVLMHLSNAGFGVLPAVNLLLFAVFTAVLCLKTDTLWTVGAFHAMWNFAEGNFYGIPVSGDMMPQTFLTTTVNGNELLSGGDFGAEGSILVTGVMIVSLLILFRKDFGAKEE